MKKGYTACVACAEEIKLDAHLCRFCRTWQADFVPKKPKARSVRSDNPTTHLLNELTRTSWVWLAGFVFVYMLGSRFDGIYGPSQPIGVFSGGVFFAAVGGALISYLLSKYSQFKRPEFHDPAKSRNRSKALWLWALISFVIFSACFAISQEYLRSH